MSKTFFGLHIVATPIGNLKDISERATLTLKEADMIICENPKHSLKLLNNLGIKKKLISLHDYNEIDVIKKISDKLFTKKIVLISDAGSPLISDPGFKLVNYCIKNNVYITSIPGPTALIPALQMSGLPINEFCFFGFFPKVKKDVSKFINNLEDNDKTTVFFVSSHKLNECLKIIQSHLGDRFVSIFKELTKLNEKVFRGYGNEIFKKIAIESKDSKGEFVVVLEGKKVKKSNNFNLENLDNEIIKLLKKFSLTDVVQIVHKLTGIKKNIVYKWVLELKKQ